MLQLVLWQEFWEAHGSRGDPVPSAGERLVAEKQYYRKGKQAAQELWTEIEAHLCKAWLLRPSCSELAYLLVQATPALLMLRLAHAMPGLSACLSRQSLF